jgi:hypothetical protein
MGAAVTINANLRPDAAIAPPPPPATARATVRLRDRVRLMVSLPVARSDRGWARPWGKGHTLPLLREGACNRVSVSQQRERRGLSKATTSLVHVHTLGLW